MKSSFALSSVACLALSAAAHAQQYVAAQNPIPITGPIQHLSYSYKTDGITPAQAQTTTGGSQGATLPCFDNSCTSGFFFQPGIKEVLDWGVKGCATTGIIGAFDVAYATTTIGAISIEVAVYDGTTGFGPAGLGVEVARFLLAGLPGSISGTPAAFLVSVDLSGGGEFCLDDGSIGWSYCFKDAGTGPLLIDVSVCGPSTGIIDAFDRYSNCPASSNVYEGTFFFGGGANDFSSFYITLYESDGVFNGAVVDNGSNVNPLIYSNLNGPAVGGTWTTSVDISGFSGVTFTAQAACGASLLVSTAFGELLVDLSQLNVGLNIALGSHSEIVPKDLALIGLTGYAQAIVKHSGGLTLTNSLICTNGY